MSVCAAPYKDIAVPLGQSEVAKVYWQTDEEVSKIAKAFGIGSARAVSSISGPARLQGVVCSICDDEIVVSCRTDAASIGRRYLAGHPAYLRKIKCDPCEIEERKRRVGIRFESRAEREEIRKTFGRQNHGMHKIAGPNDFPCKEAKDEFYASWEWRTLRTKVLKHYGARCMCCGATPDHNTIGGDPVMIVVDHIRPISKYWARRLEWDNLQVLCQECNQGKGAWDETDFRPVMKADDGEVVK